MIVSVINVGHLPNGQVSATHEDGMARKGVFQFKSHSFVQIRMFFVGAAESFLMISKPLFFRVCAILMLSCIQVNLYL